MRERRGGEATCLEVVWIALCVCAEPWLKRVQGRCCATTACMDVDVADLGVWHVQLRNCIHGSRNVETTSVESYDVRRSRAWCVSRREVCSLRSLVSCFSLREFVHDRVSEKFQNVKEPLP